MRSISWSVSESRVISSLGVCTSSTVCRNAVVPDAFGQQSTCLQGNTPSICCQLKEASKWDILNGAGPTCLNDMPMTGFHHWNESFLLTGFPLFSRIEGVRPRMRGNHLQIWVQKFQQFIVIERSSNTLIKHLDRTNTYSFSPSEAMHKQSHWIVPVLVQTYQLIMR